MNGALNNERDLRCWSCNRYVPGPAMEESREAGKSAMVFCSEDCEDIYIHLLLSENMF